MMSTTSRRLVLVTKKASVSVSDYSGRPTFSDLNRACPSLSNDRFTDKIVYYHYISAAYVCQLIFYGKSSAASSYYVGNTR